MKNGKKITITWLIIILFLISLFIIYNRIEEDKYLDLGEEVPILTELHPLVEENKNKLIELASDQNIDIVITSGARSINSQNQLYEQGRTAKGNIVTYAKGGESYHNYGLAFDYAIRNPDGEIIWDIYYDGNKDGESDWFEIAELAKGLGFEWGGDWSNFKDYPHLQMTFGLSINQLQKGLRPK